MDFLPENWSVHTTYLACAIAGSAILSLQMLLLLFGGDVGADTDMDGIEDHGDGFGFISIRTMAAFMTFFGLTGLWGESAGWGSGQTIAVAMGSGLTMMLIVAWILSLHKKLYSQGNLEPENAVGQTATVYLVIPPEGQGKGKITVSIQGRSHQFEATTRGPALQTGDAVRIVSMPTPNNFEVEAL